MKIYLVRHGIAQERIGGPVLNDSMRPLTEEGRTELIQIAQGLKKLGVKPELIVSSPLVRTKQTAEILREGLGVQAELKTIDSLAPGVVANSVYKQLKPLGRVEELMLVGHEPDMGKLAGSMMWAGPELDIPFKKAGIIRIDVSDLPPTLPGVLKWFITPKIAKLMAL